MAQIRFDKIRTLELKERHGVVVRLVRGGTVTGIEDTDYNALLTALDETPEHNSEIWGGNNSLVLTEKDIVMIDQDKAEVRLVYEHFFNEGQDLSDPVDGLIVGESRTYIQQKTTNEDADGKQIILTHTYPTDPEKEPDESYRGTVATPQSGEISIYEPQRTYTVQGVLYTSTPWVISDRIVGYLNSASWSGGAARTWMCTSVLWRVASDKQGANSYFFTIEFQHNKDTWDPTCWFVDNRTGKPVAYPEEGKGKRTIQWHPETDFDAVIGAYFQGA